MMMERANEIIRDGLVPKGFMVSFEKLCPPFLDSDHFPDKHAGERLIPTEEEAWEIAEAFARKTRDKFFNICVVDGDFRPVSGYRARMLNVRVVKGA